MAPAFAAATLWAGLGLMVPAAAGFALREGLGAGTAAAALSAALILALAETPEPAHPRSCSSWFASDATTGEGICDCGLAETPGEPE